MRTAWYDIRVELFILMSYLPGNCSTCGKAIPVYRAAKVQYCVDCKKLARKASKNKWKQENKEQYHRIYTLNNWRNSGIIFKSYEEEEEWYERYLKATHCEATRYEFEDTRIGCKCLDHDHETGRPRGIVCGAVNLIMGYCDDDPETFDDIAKYLRSKQDGT